MEKLHNYKHLVVFLFMEKLENYKPAVVFVLFMEKLQNYKHSVAVGKQPSIPLIYLGRKWTLN